MMFCLIASGLTLEKRCLDMIAQTEEEHNCGYSAL